MRWIIAIFLIFAPFTVQAHGIPQQCFTSVEELRKVFKKDHAYRMTVKGNICWHIHRNVKPTQIKEITPEPYQPYKMTPADRQRMRDYLGLRCYGPFNFYEECLNWR